MAGIKNIRDLYKKVGEKGLREVLSGEIRVTEKFDAYRFAFEKNPHDYKIYYYGKNGKTPLSKIDRTVSDLYEAAITHIESLPAEVKRAIPVRHRFGFSWFPNKKPLNTEYDRQPRNGLVLTDITIRNRQWEVTHEVKEQIVFNRWANLFLSESIHPVFAGLLDLSTIDSLVEMAKHDYALQSLNESQVYTSGFLNESSSKIEALVFESENTLFKVSDVLQEDTRDKRSHLFDILLLEICEHIADYNIAGMKSVSLYPDEAYIEVVSEIFNDFVDKHGTDFISSGLDRPDFLKNSGRINKKWVKNPKTLSLIESNSKYAYLLTIFLTNLKKPKYPSGLLNEAVTTRFNNKIEEIDRVISDDYSFLEFNSILKENDEDEAVEQIKKVDVEKAVLLLQSFFSGERKPVDGKEKVNVIITDCSQLTNDIIHEAEKLHQENGYRCILFHDVFYSQRSYSLSRATLQKALSTLVSERNDIFIGHYFLDEPFINYLMRKLHPGFTPVTVSISLQRASFFFMDWKALNAAQLGEVPKIKIVYHKNSKPALDGSLEKDSYRDFCQLCPPAFHPYWTEMKSAFDQFTYR
jgi:hypothetical protein